MIAIIDYGMGNLRSVEKALEFIGEQAQITRDPQVIEKADGVILPGVGAFGAAMENLGKFGLIEPVRSAASSEKPFLGICLGMQLLLESSEEQGVYEGLGIIPGRVLRFFQPPDITPETQALKIPHMGWNAISVKRRSRLLDGVPEASMVYFVHSYYVDPSPEAVAATTRHGIDFCSVVSHGNVFATQFHPEKSGAIGLAMLRNFAEACRC